jgi:hypothetical protein
MIYAVDVGSTLPGRKGIAFAWAKVAEEGHQPVANTDPAELASSVSADLRSGHSVALGLEAPLFIPVPRDVHQLSRGRENDGNRAWSAPSGGYVATLALHQAAWLLRELHSSCGGTCELTVDPERWSNSGSRTMLFCWEAFVSGRAKTTHLGDAATAVMYFQARMASLESAVTAENPLSLLGCAVLWSGWSTDLDWLRRPLVVLRPEEPWNGERGQLG